MAGIDLHSYNEKANQATVIGFIVSLFILIIGIVIVFLNNVTQVFSLATLIHLFKIQPILWLLLALVILLPVFIYFIYRHFTNELIFKDKNLQIEHQKTHQITDFILKITKQDFETIYEIEDQNDKLGKSLIELRDTLKSNQENAIKRRKEDEIRNWTAEGLAKFGDILRTDTNNINSLGYNIIKGLTDYINAIQGGFYLLNEISNEEKVFDLVAYYAYGRKKYADKQLKWGKGLIGTSAIERKTINISDLPDTYINVTSGLGKSNPKCLLICPMIANDELFGILEIASFNIINNHEQAFVEKVAENIASILSTVKMNMQTTRLLEESKAQSQSLVSQEEEMRQNLEELQATQEEAARQAGRFMRLETTVNHTMIRAEYSMDGILIYANTRFLKKLEYSSNSEVEGKPISMFISKRDEEWFKRIWTNLSEGGRHFEGYMKHITRTGKDLWTMATYTCIRDDEGNVERVLFLALDTTEHKKLTINLEGIVDAVNRASIKVEFDINGNIKEFNDQFLYLFKYSEKEATRLTVFDLIDNLEIDLFNKKWESIISGINFQGQFKVKTKTEEERWIRGAYSGVYDMYGDIEKVIYIGNDITNEKLMEIESKKQNETLKRQEKMLRESEKELSRKLKMSRQELQDQYKEIEKIKNRNEITLEDFLDAVITTSHDNRIIFFNKTASSLLKYEKSEVIGKNIDILFSNKTIDEDDFINKYTGPGDHKVIGKRKEVKIKSKDGLEFPVIILLSKAQVDKENTYTAFIQSI
jgi:PAS domain S-box-containing protein